MRDEVLKVVSVNTVETVIRVICKKDRSLTNCKSS